MHGHLLRHAGQCREGSLSISYALPAGEEMVVHCSETQLLAFALLGCH